MPTSLRKVKVHRKRREVKEALWNRKKRVRLFLLLSGLLLLGTGVYFSSSSVPESNGEEVKSTTIAPGEIVSFSQEPVTVDKALLNIPSRQARAKEIPSRVIVPAIDIDIAVKEAKVVDGYWEVFPDVAGFGQGSAYPGDATGNQVIFAHAREGLFLPLKEAKVGQTVYVLTNSRWFSYRIEEIKEVLPSQTEVIAPTDEAFLTLYTCTGFADSKRLIVSAKRV